jgi:LmbE family N-acetylglucosaminyl deacetylase
MGTVILSPHYDDAVLSCWCVLDGLGEVSVLNVFTAEPAGGSPVPWWDRMTGATDSVVRMRERGEEDRAALALAGREGRDLGLLDDQYRDGQLPQDAVLERIPGAVPKSSLYAPAALDAHADHVLVRDAALALARDGWPVTLYADLPHATRRGWPAWVTGEPEPAGVDAGGAWNAALVAAELTVERLTTRVRPLDAPARERKLVALAAYRTQLAGLNKFSFIPLDDARALAWEVSWQVPRSALGGEDELRREPLVLDPPSQLLDERS